MKIYTGHGDAGRTLTLNGSQPLKNSPLIQLNGSLDEVSASAGYLITLIGSRNNRSEEQEDLVWIQNVLYHIGIEVSSAFSRLYIDSSCVAALESRIDRLDGQNDPLTEFILYSGTMPAAYAQVTRSVTRRCERDFVTFLSEADQKIPQSYLFINRLSDYFFVLARYLNKCSGIKEATVSKWKQIDG
ncbi:cob(I)yrinic acid a,c-diamide adenosyltransferase [Sporolactobacillus vineae]|uniref:cob(I)yrinic acid a,c-diamide adenosyltransferase n=1 Tax=Sporolactobacillus vineae TaxID=444463 RepID=UPI000287F8C4|nr:cob(I)yrinic acid a,c-diamide adenosyltransferase [Sporolactobacillus vineae]